MTKELYQMTLEELWKLFPIFLTEHREEWDKWYEEEAVVLSKILSEVNIRSTAITGIWAKPIVDVLMEVDDADDYGKIHHSLIVNSYLCMYG